ncbi:MAG: GntR family transcriptional regulator [Candidatus Nanopelagicales bacterium]|nr:GntR family transcriptional regulator [Candidatus Nanopelagicales bacterium]
MTTRAAAGARPPDRTDPLPLWAQVCGDLRRRIEAGDFTAGFPGELPLTEEYEVSRHTIREALRVLRGEGVLRSHRGRPTVIEPTVYRQSLGTLYSLFDSVAAQGATPRSDVLRLSTTVNATVSADLGLPDDTELVVLERLRYADDQPLAHDISWLPADLARPLLDRDLTSAGLYAELQSFGLSIDAGSERVSAETAPRHIADALDLPADAAVLLLERRATAQGRPAEWRETHIRADRFSLEAQWTTAGSTLTATTEGISRP